MRSESDVNDVGGRQTVSWVRLFGALKEGPT